MSKRVLVIVDVSNLYYSIKSQFDNRRLDFQKLYDWCQQFGDIYRAIAYGAARNDEAAGFKSALKRIGFEPKYKEPKIYPTNDPSKEFRKADWDVGMAIDTVKMLPNVDIVIFCTGDGDLVPCVEWVESQGKLSIVIGCCISRQLKNIADQFQEITEEMLDSSNPTREVVVRPNSVGDVAGSSASGNP
jgi:uncharacterized LabA/DUF88 family protein